jgi:O-antigen/teichoic acid export membrane protein
MVLFPQTLIAILFSPQFVAAGQFLLPLVIAQCILQLAGVHQTLLIGFDDLKIYALIICAGQLSSAALSWFLVPHFGILGVSFAFLISNSAIFLFTLLRLRAKHGFCVSSALVLLMAYGLSVMLAGGLILSRYSDSNLNAVLFKIGLYLLFLFSLLLFLSKQERDSLLALRNRLRLSASR